MASTSQASGFLPVNDQTGELRFSGPGYAIASGYAQNIFKGDPVKWHTDGTIQLATSDGTRSGTTDGENLLGIFQGVQYRNAQNAIVQSNYWPSGTVATAIQAYVIVPRSTKIRVQFANPSPGTTVQGFVNGQCDWRPNESPAGSTVTGISKTYLTAKQATRGQFIIDSFDPGTPLTDAFIDAFVYINEHDLSAAVNTVS